MIDPRYLFLSVEGRIPRKHFWFGAGAIALFQLAVQSPLASAGLALFLSSANSQC